MEDLEGAPGSPALQFDEEPQGLNDPDDDLNPDIEEESRPNAPMGDPTADVDAFEDNEAPETVETMEDEEENLAAGGARPLDDSDEESELEELDETQFQDFDPSALNIPDGPVAVDESNVGQLGVHKRKRTEEEERERKKKRKEGKREKPKRSKKKSGDVDDEFEGGEEIDGKRARKNKVGADGRPVKQTRRAKTPTEEEEENLSPEERRRRALDRKMDEALKTNRPTRRRGGGIDLEAAADAEIENMRRRMADACSADAQARAAGKVATHKLAILPEVVELMNRNTIQSQLVDPDINILEAVRFMLEPADHDAALPNYRIQRELFAILGKLNIGKEALLSSGIGKIVLFYTKSIQPQPEIKRAAEKLIGEWMRVVLGRTKNKRSNSTAVQTATYDPSRVSQVHASQRNQAEMAAERRRKVLAMPEPGNRARVEGGLGTYTVAPVSNLNAIAGGRRGGGPSDETFRRLAMRSGAGEGRKGRN